MKCEIKKNRIILRSNDKEVKVIINFNNNSKDMVINTLLGINNFCKENTADNYILNINRYEINDKVRSEFKIKKPKIRVLNLSVNNYIKSIRNKEIINISELDRMLIIFSSKNFKDIYDYLEENKTFYEQIFMLL